MDKRPDFIMGIRKCLDLLKCQGNGRNPVLLFGFPKGSTEYGRGAPGSGHLAAYKFPSALVATFAELGGGTWSIGDRWTA